MAKKEEGLGSDIINSSHNLVAIKSLVESQKHIVDDKIIEIRMENEEYLRKHPELSILITAFVMKVLDEHPENILECAGEFFDKYYYKA